MKPIDHQVEEYLNYCLYNRRMTEQTMRSKTYILKKFAEERHVDDMQDFTNKDYNRWVEYQLKSGVSGRTVNTRSSHIIAFVKWLKDMDYDIKLRVSLIHKVKEDPPRRNFFTREQIELAKKHASELELLLISIAFDSGLRLSELTNLRLDNIKGREIRIIGKGRKARQTFITEPTRKLLDKWIERKGIQDYLWQSPLYKDGRPYSTDEIRYIMGKPFKRAGIEGFYPHAIRHSFGTDLQRNEAPLMAIQSLLGHSSVATTEKYLHGLDNRLEDTYDKYKSNVNDDDEVEKHFEGFHITNRQLASAS